MKKELNLNINIKENLLFIISFSLLYLYFSNVYYISYNKQIE